MTLRMMAVPMAQNSMVMTMPLSWIHTWTGLPSIRPTAASPPFTAMVANTPVSSAPSVPPMPCTPKASSASS